MINFSALDNKNLMREVRKKFGHISEKDWASLCEIELDQQIVNRVNAVLKC